MFRLPIFWCCLITLAALVDNTLLIICIATLAFIYSRRKIVIALFAIIAIPFLVNHQNTYKEKLFTKPEMPFLGEVVADRQSTFNRQLTLMGKVARIIVVVEKYSDISVGSVIQVQGDLERLTLEDEFNKHHIANGIGWRIPAVKSITVISKKGNAASPCQFFEREFAYELGQFLCGIAIGEYSLDPNTEELFQGLGLTHVLSVSGYNVSVIVGIIFAASARVGRRKLYLITPFILTWYLQIVGVENIPALRAVVMAIVVIIATAAGRPGSIWLALLYTNVIFFWQNPLINHSVSWQLSVSALLGILLLTDKIKAMFKFIPKAISSEFAVSLAASVATSPVILRTFGELVLIAPIANLVISPVIPYSMFLAGVTLVTSVLPSLQFIVLTIGELLWQVLLFLLLGLFREQNIILILFIAAVMLFYLKAKLFKVKEYA